MGIQLNPKAPKKVNSSVKAVLRELGLSGKNPRLLKYTNKSKGYRPQYCFNNCEDESKETGCEVVYGWMIWEDRKRSFIEAEFHSVIKVEGKFIDITPRQNYEEYIMFVPDRQRSSGRKAPDTWYSWSNLKIMNGIVREEVEELEVVELDNDYSEVRYIESA